MVGKDKRLTIAQVADLLNWTRSRFGARRARYAWLDIPDPVSNKPLLWDEGDIHIWRKNVLTFKTQGVCSICKKTLRANHACCRTTWKDTYTYRIPPPEYQRYYGSAVLSACFGILPTDLSKAGKVDRLHPSKVTHVYAYDFQSLLSLSPTFGLFKELGGPGNFLTYTNRNRLFRMLENAEESVLLKNDISSLYQIEINQTINSKLITEEK